MRLHRPGDGMSAQTRDCRYRPRSPGATNPRCELFVKRGDLSVGGDDSFDQSPGGLPDYGLSTWMGRYRTGGPGLHLDLCRHHPIMYHRVITVSERRGKALGEALRPMLDGA
jgi:hypothetical protein